MLKNKEGKIVMVIVIIAILVIIGTTTFAIFRNGNSTTVNDGINQNAARNTSRQPAPDISVSEHIIEITSSVFYPSNLEIKAGDKVTWINNDSEPHWPASAVHPTHTVYPGSGIAKCGTAEEQNIFDACQGLALGESWSFTFNQKGSWNYHDHIALGKFGKIIVK